MRLPYQPPTHSWLAAERYAQLLRAPNARIDEAAEGKPVVVEGMRIFCHCNGVPAARASCAEGGLVWDCQHDESNDGNQGRGVPYATRPTWGPFRRLIGKISRPLPRSSAKYKL